MTHWNGLGRVRGALAACLAGLAFVLSIGAGHAHERRAVGVRLSELGRLTTQAGHLLDLNGLKGRPFIVAFGYTGCPDVCPTTLLALSNDLQSLGRDADRLAVLFVTVDPDADTAEKLSDYLRSFDRRIIGLTGSAIDIEAVAHAFNAAYERVVRSDGSYSYDHTTRTYYFDRYGLLAGRHDVLKDPAKKRMDMLRRLLAQ
jgi:protein SCO1/2